MLRIIRRIRRACRLRALAAVLTVVLLLVASTASHAAYPDRVITLIVPFRQWSTDIIARVSLARLPESMDSRVVEPRRRRRQYQGDIAARAAPTVTPVELDRIAGQRRCSKIGYIDKDSRRCPDRQAPRAVAGQFQHRHACRPSRGEAAPGTFNCSPGAAPKVHLTAAAQVRAASTVHADRGGPRRWRCWRNGQVGHRLGRAALSGRPAQGARGDRRNGSRPTCRP
jgi:hypothetical protein